METIEITQKPQEIAKNQIAFDFDNLPLEDEVEEESVSLPETSFTPQNLEWIGQDVLFVVVKAKSESPFGSFNIDICGRPMIDWVVMAGSTCEKRIVEDSENIIETLKGIQTDKPYIAAFYSDTPLISKNLVFKIMDYFAKNRLNAMTLLRGYVFKTEYLKNIDSFLLGCLDKFDEKAFTKVCDGKTLAYASKTLQERILNYHEKNGVALFDKANIVIDADVEIENGVIIKRGNILKGNTFIGRDTLLNENNVIINSIVGNRCVLLANKISDSKICDNKILSCLDIIAKEV